MLTKLFCKAQTLVTEFKNDERGVTAVEYGLIAVAMATALTVIFYNGSGDTNFITQLEAAFSSIAGDLKSATTASTGS